MPDTDLTRLSQLARQLPATGPRYTSYPTANLFAEQDIEADYRHQWQQSDATPISVYVHVPFCATVCYYCACNKIHTANQVHAATYLEHLQQEVAVQAGVTGRRTIEQLHFGGGTPTSLSNEQMLALFTCLEQHYDLVDDPHRDYSIELDPRKLTVQRVQQLTGLGFNRISVGVQDFDPAVQQAINRVQSEAETAAVIDAARANGVRSVSVDLIYGLPLQTVEGFNRSLRQTLALAPDRIALYSYAHLPQMFKIQRQINSDDLPDSATKLALLLSAIEVLEAHDYVYLGMDHFAKRTDSLVQASHDGTLQRNFMGYTTHGHHDLLGLGISAIGQTGDLFSQNHKTLNDYYAAIDAGALPLAKGYLRNSDDKIRNQVIQQLMCTMRVDKTAFAANAGISFDDYFANAAAPLSELESQGLVENHQRQLRVTSMGRFFIRNICMVFDAYLSPVQDRFSKTV